MEITFRTRKLEKAYSEYARAVKAYGDKVARKYIQRINIIKSVQSYCQMLCMEESGGVPYFLNTINKFNTSNNFG